MSCPDELTLDLWSADALPAEEAASIAAHVVACPSCTEQLERWRAASRQLHAALDLDQDERAYLASLNLAGTWRSHSANATDSRWGLLALFGVTAAFIGWTLAAQPFGDILTTANQVGLSTVLVTTALGVLLGLGQALISVSTNPALGLSQPLLAVLALAVLFWPRIKSAAHYLYLQGALS